MSPFPWGVAANKGSPVSRSGRRRCGTQQRSLTLGSPKPQAFPLRVRTSTRAPHGGLPTSPAPGCPASSAWGLAAALRRRLLGQIAIVLLLAGAASAAAQVLPVGDILINADGGFAPRALPRHKDAPITLHGGGRISTVSGDLPPILETISIEFDRHGSLQAAGLEICRKTKLEARTVPQARHACPGAIVGRGFGHAIVALPEGREINVDSSITLFNGPTVHGDHTVLAHAYVIYPAPVALIVPVVIERIHKGVYGYRTKARIPKIAGGAGIPISGHLKIGRKWTYKGVKHTSTPAAKPATGRRATNSASRTAPSYLASLSGPAGRVAEDEAPTAGDPRRPNRAGRCPQRHLARGRGRRPQPEHSRQRPWLSTADEKGRRPLL